jgi:protein SCO1/2
VAAVPRKPLFAALLVLVAGGCGGGAGEASYRGSRPPPDQKLPTFALRDQAGNLVRSGDLRGKAVLVTFLDSACHEACPPTAVEIGRALRLLPLAQRRRVAAVAVSVDPRVDTPARVREFLRRNHADRELTFLLGTGQQLRPVWDAFHVLSAVDSGDSDIHSILVEIYDREGTWVSSLHTGVDLNTANLRHDLVSALG